VYYTTIHFYTRQIFIAEEEVGAGGNAGENILGG
jgi:hypothetical protein